MIDPKLRCYIPMTLYYAPTHSVTLLSISDTPIWLGFIVEEDTQRVLDARWSGDLATDTAMHIDQWCLQSSGVLYDQGSDKGVIIGGNRH